MGIIECCVTLSIQTTSTDEFIDFKRIRLTCPITTQKILQPVCVQNVFFYECIAAKEMITS